jgi:hypothetical protein
MLATKSKRVTAEQTESRTSATRFAGRAASTMFTINQLGTFDVANYGDLLYPLVFRNILKEHDARLSLRQYSLLDGDAPQGAGFKTHSVQSLFEAGRTGPCRIVVGGGDILRTDWETVAAHYGRIYGGHLGKRRSSVGTVSLLQYHLRKHLPGLREKSFFANRFRQRRMNYPAAGPFLIDTADLPAGSVVSYLSCGVPHDFAPSERNKVSRTFDHARFIYLRDEQSAEKLRRSGVRREIHVAPDLTVTLGEQFDYATETRKGREILSELGVKGERPVLCFQSNRYTGFREDEIVEHLKRYRQRTDWEVILLPLGYCHGDHGFLQRLAKKSGGAFKLVNAYSVFDIISVIAASDVFVGTSLHGNITAFSFGIPHLFGPLPVDKSEGFLKTVNLPLELKLRSWGEMNDKIDTAKGLGRPFFSERARKARLRVHEIIDELLENY